MTEIGETTGARRIGGRRRAEDNVDPEVAGKIVLRRENRRAAGLPHAVAAGGLIGQSVQGRVVVLRIEVPRVERIVPGCRVVRRNVGRVGGYVHGRKVDLLPTRCRFTRRDAAR